MRIKSLLIASLLIAAVSLAGCGGAKSEQTAAGGQAPKTEQKSEQKTEQKADIKSGAEAMRKELAELKEAVEKNDAEKAKKAAEETEEAWEKFEDAVKAKDKAMYEKVEDPLGVITAAAKQSPLDTQTLKEQIAKLDSLLAELAK
jgi:iron uptake system EfeUOB component EfeO/EfeM